MYATNRWSSVINANITDFKLDYRLEEWKISARGITAFDHSKTASINL
jgi:hypothetical protein